MTSGLTPCGAGARPDQRPGRDHPLRGLYKVLWEGYPREEIATWEDADNPVHDDFIDAFEDTLEGGDADGDGDEEDDSEDES